MAKYLEVNIRGQMDNNTVIPYYQTSLIIHGLNVIQEVSRVDRDKAASVEDTLTRATLSMNWPETGIWIPWRST